MVQDTETKFIRDMLTSNLFADSPTPTHPADLDWDRLALLLTRHRLSAHFFVLGREQHEAWPDAFLETLRRDRYSLMMYGDQCAIHIRALLERLNEADIPVIVMKGWAYIPVIYGGDHSQRVCEDIDILVHPQAVDEAEKILIAMGFYKEMESWPGYHRRYLNGTRYFVGGQSGVPGSTFSIGLHWGLWHMPSYDHRLIDIEAVFERAQPLQVASVPALKLSVEDHVVYACAHLGLHHHFDSSLFRFYELAKVILDEGDSIDWKQVSERASQWRVILPVQYALKKTEALWPGIIPEWVLEELGQKQPAPIELLTLRWIKITRGKDTFDHLLTWLTFPDWKKRFVIMLQDIFPGPDYLRYRYGNAPGNFWPLLYFRRLFHALHFLFK